MSKAARRQRKKDQRRQKIEAELREVRARRRRRLIINLAVVGAVVVGISALVTAQRPREAKKKEAECKTAEVPGETSDVPLPAMTIDTAKTYSATIETSEGTIVVDLDAETSPCTVNSFVSLARGGFFDGLTFHRIVPGFAIQGGDPKGDGSGGPGYKVTEAPPPETKYERGIVAMAKSGADPAGASGSQFFIVPGDAGTSLNGTAENPAQYALLGRVREGLEVLAKIEARPLEGERPVEPITIVKITITESSKTP